MVKFSKTKTPKPPVPLSPEETYLYKFIVKFLQSNNAYNVIDGLTIAEAVQCYFRMKGFEKAADDKTQMGFDEEGNEVVKSGWIQEFENGANLSCEAILYYKEVKRWESFCKSFGLHVKARDTIKVFKADDGGQKGFLRHLSVLHKQAAGG